MLAGERVYAPQYTPGAHSPSLSPLAGREPERGVPILVELLTRRILSCTRPESSWKSAEDTCAATAAGLKAGADGLLFSRKYCEMRLANLAAAGQAVRDFKG